MNFTNEILLETSPRGLGDNIASAGGSQESFFIGFVFTQETLAGDSDNGD